MRNLTLSLLLGILLTSCGPTQKPTTWQSQLLQPAPPSSMGFSVEKIQEIDRLFQWNVEEGNIAGATALVARRGKIVYFQSTGYEDLENRIPLEKEAIFRIASQTKGITTVAIMRLYEEGKLDLPDPISKHLSEFKYPKIIDLFNEKDSSYVTRPAKREVSIQDLLTHTSGYAYPGNGGDAGNAIYAKAMIMNGVPSKSTTLKEEMQKISKLPLIHEPGEKFTYGLSTDILGYLVEVLSGKNLEEYFRSEIFEPLGMKDTYFHLPQEKHDRLMKLYLGRTGNKGLDIASDALTNYPKNMKMYFSGGGGLSSTAMDYAIFIQMLLNQGEYNGIRILKPETIQMMRTNHIGELGAGSLFLPLTTDKFGLGFEVISPSEADSMLITEGSYGWGGAFGSLYWIDPTEELVAHLVIQKAGDYAKLRYDFINTVYKALKAKERNLLSNSTTEKEVADQLLSGTSWVGFPAYSERDAWNRIPGKYRKLIIQSGEEAIDFEWGIVKATDFLEFERSGNRNIMQHPLSARREALQDLVLAELFEGNGRFLDQIINGIWALSEQTTWALSAHMYLQEAGNGLPDVEEPVIDLIVGEISALFSWTHYFLEEEFDKIDPLISKRIRYEIQNKVLAIYYERDDFWWMSFGGSHINNWNPWVNHNILTTMLLMEEDPETKAKFVYKSMRSVDKFINFYEDDGGCDEGPSYWGHAGGAMFEYLELLRNATGSKIDIFDQEIIKNIGSYIYKANVAYPYVINFADASSKSGGRPGVVYRYGESIADPVMQSYGAFLAKKANWDSKLPGGNLEAQLINLFRIEEITSAKKMEPLIYDFYLPDLQICGARDSEGSRNGFFFAAKGGHNQENHNHNDVGHFILYYNGHPALIDVGVATYTRQTFSEDRYSLWAMQSQYHNTPTINGMQQAPGMQYKAKDLVFKNSGKEVRFQLDISEAYPQEAMVDSWIRTIKFKRGNSFSVEEDFSLSKHSGETTMNLMTCLVPENISEGKIQLQGEDFALILEYDPRKVELTIEEKVLVDARLKNSWGEVLYRMVFTYKGPSLNNRTAFMIKPL